MEIHPPWHQTFNQISLRRYSSFKNYNFVIALKIVNQFWFILHYVRFTKLHAFMWMKLTQKTFISLDLKCWLWNVTFFVPLHLKNFKKLKKKGKKFLMYLFLFTIFVQIWRSYSCTFFGIHQIQKKNAKLVPKTPNWRAPVNKYGAAHFSIFWRNYTS